MAPAATTRRSPGAIDSPGAATGEEMLRAVLEADPRLFAKLSASGAFGTSVLGLGYDDGDGEFALSDGTIFGAGGVFTSGPADGAAPVDAGDRYAEGWFEGFWHYAHADENPFAEGAWASGAEGMSDRELVDGAWDGWAFDADFSFDDVPSNPAPAPAPEPGALLMLATAAAVGLLASRRGAARRLAIAVFLVSSTGATSFAADPWADLVVSYQQGEDVDPKFTNPASVLGEPTRFTSPGVSFGGAATPFQAAFGGDEVLTIGPGGEITVAFDEPVEDDPANPFGIDLLVFGNSFYTLDSVGVDGVAVGLFSEGGDISVSSDGVDFVSIAGVVADGLYPTLGYVDVSGPQSMFGGPPLPAGDVLTDFTLPVDPAFDPVGKNIFEIADGYAGSGGGAGVDLAATGLSSISFVRVSSGGGRPEIDAFVDVRPVPEPTALLPLLVAAAGSLARRRRVPRVGA